MGQRYKKIAENVCALLIKIFLKNTSYKYYNNFIKMLITRQIKEVDTFSTRKHPPLKVV